MSSVASQQMKDFNAGAQVYLDRINARGGVKGRPVKLVTLDDGFSADKAAVNAKKLIDESGVVALFGSRGTDPSEAVLKVAESTQVPLIAPITGADSVRASRYAYPVRASYRAELEEILQHMAFVPTKVALLVQNDKFGNPLAAFIESRVAAGYKNITLVGKVPFERKTTSLSKETEQILKTSANAVIALCNPSSCEAFLREIAEQTRGGVKMRPMVYQTSISDMYAQFEKIGAAQIEGNPYSQILPDPHRGISVLGKEYIAAMTQAKVPTNYRTYEGYVSAKVLVEGLRRAKSIKSADIKDALDNLGALDLGGLTVRYSPDNHQGSGYVELVTIDRHGKLVH